MNSQTLPLISDTPAQAASACSRWRLWLLFLALAILAANRYIAPNIHRDWLNLSPGLATIYLAYCVVRLDRVFGRNIAIRPFIVSPWFRSLGLLVLGSLTLEFGLRSMSYHRALLYQREGDLLFTPVPNQEYTEKVSLSSSRINDLGLRGGPVGLNRNTKILALGDSVTYGYGVDDEHTYPARLQKSLDAKFPGQYAVFNGGVNAYPVSFEHQKFLFLWQKGLHPDIVIVGYSFNEGRLGHLVGSDEATKRAFAQRVQLKNLLRTIAIYNVVVENWARRSYDRMTRNMVPGTNFVSLSQEDVNILYREQLQDFVDDLHAHHVKPVFLLLSGYDARINNYDDAGPFQQVFRKFAEDNGIPLVRSKDALLKGERFSGDLRPYFQDLSHMKPVGTEKVGEMLADTLPQILQ